MNEILYPALPVLIVDDEATAISGVSYLLESEGISNIIGCQQSKEVLPLLARKDIGVVLLDLRMPAPSGQELLRTIVAEFPTVPVIVVTGYNDIEIAVECMRVGAFDYLVKPVEQTRIVSCVKRAIELYELQREYDTFKRKIFDQTLEHPDAFSHLVTSNPAMKALFRYIEAIAPSSRPVLITGETGVGKELIAKALHSCARQAGPLIAVNVAGFDDSVFSDTLFGHLKGAFTGAHESRNGLITEASGGTLFLDEIGDLELVSQVKLLRLLQEHSYFPLGADAPRKANTRIVVATNRDLEALQKAGKFRPDLYFRLATHRVHVPPLRERLDDLPLLVDHFLTLAAGELGKKKPSPPKELYGLLAAYHYPGNVRELEAMVFEAMCHPQSSVLSMHCFDDYIKSRGTIPPKARSHAYDTTSVFSMCSRLPTLEEAREMLVHEALTRSHGVQTQAARLLGITPSGLNKLLKRSGAERGSLLDPQRSERACDPGN